MKSQQTLVVEPPFKDYCLILQVHPEADAGMIEAAYWHLARRYNDAAAFDPLAKANLDVLNEAYGVLSSPSRREEYFSKRNAVLGEGALPVLPPPEREPPPLAVLEKQRPRPRQAAPPRRLSGLQFGLEQLMAPSWQNALVVLATLTAATAGLAASASLLVVLGLLIASMLLSAIPLLREAPRVPFLAALLQPSQDEPVTGTYQPGSGDHRTGRA